MTAELQRHRGFFISQIGAEGSPERARADEVFDHIIQPVAAALNIDTIRADRDPRPGQITTQMIKTLLASKVIFADLTGRNPNVYYELGVSHSFGLPVIILVDHPDSLSFDTQNERVIAIGDSGEIRVSQAERAKAQLQEVLRAVLHEDFEPDNLITAVAASRSIDALAPENPIASELAAIRGLMEGLSVQLGDLDVSRPQTGSALVLPNGLRVSELRKNETLIHEKWGQGRLVDVNLEEGVVSMDFPGVGRKRLLISYTSLRRPQDSQSIATSVGLAKCLPRAETVAEAQPHDPLYAMQFRAA
jgi:hypothetical protein